MCDAVILTTGTYMKANILVGDKRTVSGPKGTRPSLYLSENLEKLGFKLKKYDKNKLINLLKIYIDTKIK